MRTNERSQRLLIASLERWEASGNVEPGASRVAKSAVRELGKARTRNQRSRALNRLARVFLRNLNKK